MPKLTTNFTSEELSPLWNGPNSGPLPADVAGRLFFLALNLQRFRDAIGSPFVVTSGYRSPEHNSEVPGSSKTSDHSNALAADGYFPAVKMGAVWKRVKQLRVAGAFPAFDQIIFYPETTGHIHIGFGSRMRGQVLVKRKDGKYYPLISELEFLLPGWTTTQDGMPLPIMSAPAQVLPPGTGDDEDLPSIAGGSNDLIYLGIGLAALGVAVWAYVHSTGGKLWP